MRRVCAVVAALLLTSVLALAQTDASVSGTVTDPTNAHVVGATITATNTGTGVKTTINTNEAGIYVFAALPPGKYTFTAEHAGFRKSSVNDVTLEVGAQLTINLGLELGQTTETVEVQSTATEVSASTATLGAVIGERKIQELPLVGRSAYDLVGTQVGVIINGAEGVNINGAQTGAINYTTDGLNTQDNLLNGAFNTMVSNTVSIDRVEEFRIVTSPADAEYGRGSAQVQMVTRAGTNAFHGSAWEELRNTDLNANDWFNNQKGTNPLTGAQIAPRNVLVRNQFGTRFGGPVKKNKTFFNGIWEEDHQNQRLAENSVVFTPTALAGNFRYFPGATNASAASAIPTVTISGQPLQPASATGPLQTVSVFGLDPNRFVPDPTGTVKKYLSIMPAPNNYLVGDGLNTAGFNWAVPVIDDFQLYEGRIDHNFNEKNHLALTLSHQAYTSTNVAYTQPFPASPVGLAPTETTEYTARMTTAFRPNLLNEAMFGVFRPRVIVWEDIDPNGGAPGAAGQKLLPTANGVPFYPNFASGITNPLVSPGGPTGTGSSNRISQTWQYGESLTWIKGRHTFKGGTTIAWIQNAGFDTGGVTPTTTAGAGSAVKVVGINTLPGIGTNLAGAQNLLTDLGGDFASITEALNAPGGKQTAGFIPGLSRYSDLHTHEYSFYFKDDFKLRPNFTLNLGVRYEFYGVPRDYDGREVGLVGGSAALFGQSGTNMTALFTPGASSGLGLTQLQLEGPKTNNPDAQLYRNDTNNWAPFVGFAWSLPGEGSLKWLTGGKDKTVIRAGYGISYQRNSLYLTHQITSFEPNGLTTSPLEQPTSILNFGNVVLPIPTTAVPLATTPLTGPRNSALWAFDSGLKAPSIQNYNFSIQRLLDANTSITLSFVGSAAKDLLRTFDVNELNISTNGFLQAFTTVQQGGDSPLMDALVGSIPGLNSVTMRNVSFFQTYFANNNPGGLALLLNNSAAVTGIGGSFVAGAKLPPNFFVVNPAFPDAFLATNSGHSTYNSFQFLLNRRFNRGLTIQGSYVFSKALGDNSAGDNADFLDDYRTLTNFGLDKQVLAFNHAQVVKINGIYELPFGPGKPFLSSNNGILSRIVGGWQIGSIFTYETGAPLSITANQTGFGGYTANFSTYTADQVGKIPSGVQEVGNGVVYFQGFNQVADPSIANITSLGNLNKLSTMKAITDSSGNLVFVNPVPGQLGTLGIDTLTGPRIFRIDMNLIKRIKITERFVMQLGVTAENLTNTEVFAAPTANIDSASFGHITATASGFTPRIMVAQLRLNF